MMDMGGTNEIYRCKREKQGQRGGGERRKIRCMSAWWSHRGSCWFLWQAHAPMVPL